jgi:hypothetical protein
MQQRLGSSAQVCAEAAAVDAIAAAQKKRDAERARAAAAAAAEASRGEQSIPRGEQHQQPHPQAAEQAAQPQGAEAAPSSSAGRVVHSWLYPIMNKCGLEVLVAGKGDHKLQGSLAGLSKKSFVRAKVDPQPARKAPSVLPAVQDTIGPEEYHRVMAFAEEYGLMGRPRHGMFILLCCLIWNCRKPLPKFRNSKSTLAYYPDAPHPRTCALTIACPRAPRVTR